MVEVVSGPVSLAGLELPGEETEDPNEVDRFPAAELWLVTVVAAAVAELVVPAAELLVSASGLEVGGGLTRATVLEAGAQSKPMLWMPTSQFSCSEWSGSLNVTEVAPPHCEF